MIESNGNFDSGETKSFGSAANCGSTCGNGVCNTGENSTTCPVDCSSIILGIGKPGEAGSGSFGFMFTVLANRDIHVNAIDFYAGIAGVAQVEVFHRQGDHNGVEFNSGAWTSVYDNTVDLVAGTNDRNRLEKLNNGKGVPISAGMINSFYLFTLNTVRYENTRNGPFEISNNILEIFDGTGTSAEEAWTGDAGTLFSPRAFRGAIM